jgi:hypothetical protein
VVSGVPARPRMAIPDAIRANNTARCGSKSCAHKPTCSRLTSPRSRRSS